MKTLKGTLTAIAIAALCVGASFSANAAMELYTGVTPINLFDEGIVGTIRGLEQAESYAQQLLNLSIGGTFTETFFKQNGDIDYVVKGKANTVFDYTGTLGTVTYKDDTGGTYVSGWEYVLAKYDGPNAGSVLFYLGGNSLNLPRLPANIWPDADSNGNGDLSISHWVGFNPTVPEPATAIAGALLLLPFGASAVRVMRRKA